MPKIGSKLRELRRRRDLGVRELAIRSGISHSTISLMERDKNQPLDRHPWGRVGCPWNDAYVILF
nr:helix-turn-helix domain-containing protein [Aminobacter anthyllidis]